MVAYIPILRGGNLPQLLDRSPFWCHQLFDHSFAIVAPSRYMFQEFEKRGFNPVWIPNHINISEYEFKSRSFVAPKLLWVRSFNKIYNPEMAIFVLKELSNLFPEAELCMIGGEKDGSLERCKALAHELHLDKNVTFTGRLSKPEWRKESAKYDIFINTSSVDNMPVTLIEAMALGIPVVTTSAGGITSLVSDMNDAIVVESDDTHGMVQKIIELQNNPELVNKLTINARIKAKSFDWETIEPQWINLINSAIYASSSKAQ